MEELMSYEDNFYKRNTRKVGEEKCEEYLDSKNITYARYGFDELNKIPYNKFVMIPELLRNSPDYVVMHNKATFLEVKCCRTDIRLKLLDMASYDWWSEFCPLVFFLYSTAHKENVVIKYTDLKEISKTCETDTYDDNGKEYYLIPWKKLNT